MQNAKCKIKNGDRYMNVVYDKSFQFAIRIVKLYRFLMENKREFVLSKQLLRCGTSIGANVAEAEKGQSLADFYAKMNIALKEANETKYWLQLLHATEYLTNQQFVSLDADVKELIALLVAICKRNPSAK
jgi:four helix bundle protein